MAKINISRPNVEGAGMADRPESGGGGGRGVKEGSQACHISYP